MDSSYIYYNLYSSQHLSFSENRAESSPEEKEKLHLLLCKFRDSTDIGFFQAISLTFPTFLPFPLPQTVEEPDFTSQILINPEKQGDSETKKEPREFFVTFYGSVISKWSTGQDRISATLFEGRNRPPHHFLRFFSHCETSPSQTF